MMADERFSDKRQSFSLAGTLALRVIFTSLIFLLLPLMCYSIFMMRQDYQMKIKDMFSLLDLMGTEEAKRVDELIIYKKNILNLVSSQEQMQKAAGAQKPFVFSWVPLSEQKEGVFVDGDELIIAQNVPEKNASVSLSISLKELVSYLGNPDFHFSLIDKNVSPKQELIQQEEKISFFDLFKNQERQIGLVFPLKQAELSLLVNVPEKQIIDWVKTQTVWRLSLFFVCLLILGGFCSWWMIRRLSKPLRSLCYALEEIEKGNTAARFKKEPMGFEINILGERVNQMVQSLLEQKFHRKVLENELKIGHEIQKSMLPKGEFQIKGLDVKAKFKPAKEVTGDFYDLFSSQENQLMLVIADGAGKGISACLYSFSLRSSLRACCSSSDDLAEILHSANKLFCLDASDSAAFVTAWIGIYHPKTQELQYSSCGHPPALLKRKNGSIEQLQTKGMAFGVTSFEQVEVATVKLLAGDTLLLYTDGVLEAHNLEGELFGFSRLLDLFSEARDSSAQALVDRVFGAISRFEQGALQQDDTTVVALFFS